MKFTSFCSLNRLEITGLATSGMIFFLRWDRSSLAFSSVTAPNEPNCFPPFIAGGARGGAAWGAAELGADAARHRSSEEAASERSPRPAAEGDAEEEAQASLPPEARCSWEVPVSESAEEPEWSLEAVAEQAAGPPVPAWQIARLAEALGGPAPPSRLHRIRRT